MMRLDLADIATLAGRIRAGAISSVEVTERLLDRIDRVDGDLHAFSALMRDEALADARRADAEMRGGRRRGLLHGVPVALKDLVFVEGRPATPGMSTVRPFCPDHDAAVVERLREAGAVILGKLAMTEAAFFSHHPSVTPPLNPWHPAYWTGASSSGAGAALAAGLCLGAIGSDSGGSIRIPSACCGLTGLKPTAARVSCEGSMPLAPSLDCLGPMARSAHGVAALLDAIAATGGACLDADGRLVSRDEPLRIGVDRAFVEDGLDDDVAAAFDATLRAFRRLGLEVRPVRFPATEAAMRAWATICAAEARHVHRETFPASRARYGALLASFLDSASAVGPAQVEEARTARTSFTAALDELFSRVDVVLTPTLPMRVPTIERIGNLVARGETGCINRFTQVLNLSGHPAISFNAGACRDGLPIGMQLVGRRNAEATLCRSVARFQDATDWHLRVPPGGLDSGRGSAAVAS